MVPPPPAEGRAGLPGVRAQRDIASQAQARAPGWTASSVSRSRTDAGDSAVPQPSPAACGESPPQCRRTTPLGGQGCWCSQPGARAPAPCVPLDEPADLPRLLDPSCAPLLGSRGVCPAGRAPWRHRGGQLGLRLPASPLWPPLSHKPVCVEAQDLKAGTPWGGTPLPLSPPFLKVGVMLPRFHWEGCYR